MKSINDMSTRELCLVIRSYRRMVSNIGKLLPTDPDFDRAGGGALCELCGLELRYHPTNNGVTICCDGRSVKL